MIVSFDKAENVVNDVSLYCHKEDALAEMEEIAAELLNATEILEEQEDGQKRCVHVFNTEWEAELYERELGILN